LPDWNQREAVTGWMPCSRAHCFKFMEVDCSV